MSLFDRFLGAIRLGDDDYDDDDDYNEDDELDEEDDEDFEEERPSKLFSKKFRKKSKDTESDDIDDEEPDEDEEDEEDDEEEEKPRRFFFFGGRKKASRDDEEEDEEDEEDDEDNDTDEEEEAPRTSRRSSGRSSKSSDRKRTRRETSNWQAQNNYTSSAHSSYSSMGTGTYSSAGASSARTGYQAQDIDWSSFVTQKPGKKQRQQRRQNTGAKVRVEVIVPKSMEDTQDIAELLMYDSAVILNLEFIDVDTARRIVDFSCGACYALNGGVQQVSNYVYILTPVNVEVSGDFTSMFTNFFDYASKRSLY